jgi:RNA polymerase sigma-70 factor (ECF subfamily)
VVIAIRQMPPLQRRAVVLAAIGGWTAKEVSEREGVPLGTAKTRIRSGLLALRDLLDAATGEAEGVR